MRFELLRRMRQTFAHGKNGDIWLPLRDVADDLIRRRPRPECERTQEDERLQEEVRTEYRQLREQLESTLQRGAC